MTLPDQRERAGLDPADLDELVRVARDWRYSNEFIGIMLRAKLAASDEEQT